MLHNSVKQKTLRTSFLKLSGDMLAMVGDYLNEKLPVFIFTNRITFKIFMQCQIQSYEIKRQEMFHQAYLLQRELDRITHATKFDLSY